MGDLLLRAKRSSDYAKTQRDLLCINLRSLLFASKSLSGAHQQMQVVDATYFIFIYTAVTCLAKHFFFVRRMNNTIVLASLQLWIYIYIHFFIILFSLFTFCHVGLYILFEKQEIFICVLFF